jgi:hypothetical protein
MKPLPQLPFLNPFNTLLRNLLYTDLSFQLTFNSDSVHVRYQQKQKQKRNKLIKERKKESSRSAQSNQLKAVGYFTYSVTKLFSID